MGLFPVVSRCGAEGAQAQEHGVAAESASHTKFSANPRAKTVQCRNRHAGGPLKTASSPSWLRSGRRRRPRRRRMKTRSRPQQTYVIRVRHNDMITGALVVEHLPGTKLRMPALRNQFVCGGVLRSKVPREATLRLADIHLQHIPILTPSTQGAQGGEGGCCN